MCFTFLGRLETRLCTLILPFGLCVLYAWIYACVDFYHMWLLMGSIGLLLDLTIYPLIFRYQPRYMLFVLGLVEYVILSTVFVRIWQHPQSSPYSVRVVIFYILAFLLAYLTSQSILPLFFPRWGEDGGEIH